MVESQDQTDNKWEKCLTGSQLGGQPRDPSKTVEWLQNCDKEKSGQPTP